MSWWKRRKCATCKKVLKPKKHHIHELRIGTAEGTVEVEVCDTCARFWDGTAEVLSSGRKKRQEREDQGPPEEVD